MTSDAPLILHGTIETIAPSSNGHRRWIVTLRVDAVVEGVFAGDTFSFSIHSPARSGLATGQSRLVRALPVSGGYTVDEFQWLPG